MSERIPTPPRGLSKRSKENWRLVHQGWHLDDAGRPMLRVALSAEDRADEAQAIVKREGMIILVGKVRRAHPALQIVKDSQLIALKAWRQLGLQGAPAGAAGRPPGVV